MQGVCGAWLVLPSNHFKGCFLSCPWIAKSRKDQEWFHETTFWEVEKLRKDIASKMFYLIDLALVQCMDREKQLKLREGLVFYKWSCCHRSTCARQHKGSIKGSLPLTQE